MRRRCPLAVCLAAALAFPASAAGHTVIGEAPPGEVFSVRTPPGPGPARYDRVRVERFGSPEAGRVLVLVPDAGAGAGSLSFVADDLADRLAGWQVWATERRTGALEDRTGFHPGNPDVSARYYLGGGGFRPVDGAAVPYARRWGLRVAVDDLHAVVTRARASGERRVILAGHGLGAEIAEAYAAWDFAGRPGYSDLRGLGLIDGATAVRAAPASARAVESALRAMPTLRDDPWPGVLSQLAGRYATTRPAEPAAAVLNPPFPMTNEALVAHRYDREVREVTPVQRLAQALERRPTNFGEWYVPARLGLDVRALRGLRRTRATGLLGLRAWHRRSLDLPLYALQTDAAGQRVLRGAVELIAGSDVPLRRSRLVDAADTMSHLDPLLADPSRSALVATLLPWLESVGGR